MKMNDRLLRKAVISTAAMLGSVLLLAGCEQEGPAERAGRTIDDSAERAGERMEQERMERRSMEQESMQQERNNGSHLRDSTDRPFTDSSNDRTQ